MADAARPDRLDDISVDDRRRQVAGLYLARRTQVEIARALKISQSTVSTDLAAIRKQWQKEALTDVEAAILREAAELDAIEAQAAAEFSKTKELGWLLARLKCKAQRSALLGLNKQRLELSGPNGGAIPFREVIVEIPRPIEPEADLTMSNSAAPELPPADQGVDNTLVEPAEPASFPRPYFEAPAGNGFLEVTVELPR
jgi:hypothetical protein